jgi:hypothetical protein
MPNLAVAAPDFDMDNVPQDVAQAKFSDWAGLQEEAAAGFGAMSNRLTQLIGPSAVEAMAGAQGGTFGAPMLASPIQVPRVIDPDTANEVYGGPGLKWTKPVDENDAAWASTQARENLARSTVLAQTNRNPLLDFGAQMAGGLFDPVGLGIMTATGGIGEAALSRLGWEATEASGGLLTAGRVANLARVGASGLIENAPFVGANAALTNLTGDEYSAVDGLRDLALGAIVHTGMHVALSPLRSLAREPTADPQSDAAASPQTAVAPLQGPAGADLAGGEAAVTPPAKPAPAPTDFVPPDGVPDKVDQLPGDSRRAAWLIAVDQVSRGEDPDVEKLVDQERQLPGPAQPLDEASAAVTMPSWRPSGEEPAVAVSTEGTATPVAYGLVEMRDLITSHHDDLSVNGEYPPELQPRDRTRAGSMASNYELEQKLRPELLMDDVSAAAGAPIVSPGGIVESGNGRVIALRRALAKGSDVAKAYRAALEARGLDTTGMESPVRVRVRAEALTASERSALAHEWNKPVTETLSAVEQAAADARGIDDVALSKLDGTPAGERAFARYFIQHIATGETNQLANAEGELSLAGQRRIDAALMTKAFGDARLVSALFEDPDTNIKAIGEALRQVAGPWAALRSAVGRGLAHQGLDLTPALMSAVEFVRAARDAGINTGRFIGELLAQQDMFTGESRISPATEAVLRLFFREGAQGDQVEASFQRPRAAAKVAAVLKAYAEAAIEAGGEADMFGSIPHESEGAQILRNITQRFAGGDTGQGDLLRPPGRTEADLGPGGGPVPDQPRAAVEGPIEGGEGGSQPGRAGAGEAGGGGEGQGRGNEPAGGVAEGVQAAPSGDQVIAADPELARLEEDTSIAAGALAVTPSVEARDEPNTIAATINAAAQCLLDNVGEIFG